MGSIRRWAMKEAAGRSIPRDEVAFRVAAYLLQMRVEPLKKVEGAAHPDWSAQEIRRLMFLRYLRDRGAWEVRSGR
jgi:hypothetical protein